MNSVDDYAIEIDDAVMKFGDFTAVNGVTLKIKKGEIIRPAGPERSGEEHHDKHAAGAAEAHFREESS